VCVLYCAQCVIWATFVLERETQWNTWKWGTGGHQAVHPSALTSSFSF
jgi:hypothetical protein